MNFQILSLIISSVYLGTSFALIILLMLEKEPHPRLFDLAIASLGALGSLLVIPSNSKKQ